MLPRYTASRGSIAGGVACSRSAQVRQDDATLISGVLIDSLACALVLVETER